jgi:carbonic anhydrase/acetyltransferase-like protein (isoleucine patch superfamily)
VEAASENSAGSPVLVGEDALVGHMAVLHGCTLEDRAFVGMGAVLMDDCRVGTRAMVAAGAMLTRGKVVPPAELWAGRPARFIRGLTAEQTQAMLAQTLHYVENARLHRSALDQLRNFAAE